MWGLTVDLSQWFVKNSVLLTPCQFLLVLYCYLVPDSLQCLLSQEMVHTQQLEVLACHLPSNSSSRDPTFLAFSTQVQPSRRGCFSSLWTSEFPLSQWLNLLTSGNMNCYLLQTFSKKLFFFFSPSVNNVLL